MNCYAQYRYKISTDFYLAYSFEFFVACHAKKEMSTILFLQIYVFKGITWQIYFLTLNASKSKEVFDSLPLCQMFTEREHY